MDIKEVKHLLVTPNRFTYVTEIHNCISHLRNIAESASLPVYQRAAKLLNELDDDDTFIDFIKEQLQLKDVAPKEDAILRSFSASPTSGEMPAHNAIKF